MKLDGKIALVTGSSGGIGQALVRLLKENKVKCILIERTSHKSEDEVYGCDFTSPYEVMTTAEKIAKKHPQLNFIFNIAGVGVYKNIEDLSINEWIDSHSINLHAPFILIKELLPLLKKSDDPFIFNMGSAMGITPTAGRTSYVSSKFGLRGFSLTLSKELDPEGIKVSLLTLGSVMTNFGSGGIKRRTDLASHGKKYLSAEDVAEFIVNVVKSENKKAEYELFPEE